MDIVSGIDPMKDIPDITGVSQILIVDDEPRFRSAYRELLAGKDRHIEECATGREALQRLGLRDIDVVVLDLKLPDIGGIEIMEWLARNKIGTPRSSSSAPTSRSTRPSMPCARGPSSSSASTATRPS